MAMPPFLCKAGDDAFPASLVAHADFSRIEELVLTVTLLDGRVAVAHDIEALELAMQIKPSALEGRRFSYAKRAWWIHNLIGHPLMQILAWMGAHRLAFLVHDRTVPMPLGAKRARSGTSKGPA